MKPSLIIFGAGGHARTVVALARRMGIWKLVAVLDRISPKVAEEVDGIPVKGSFDSASAYLSGGVGNAALAVGDNDERAGLFARFSAVGFSFPVLRHPTALLEDNVTVGEGTVICAGAIICAQARIGRGVIINSGAIVDHEVVIGDHAHIAPGCRVAGRVQIGRGVMLGIGCSVRDKIVIGDGAMVGAGSVVVADIEAQVVAYGVPARIVHPRQQ